jgi:hypothetical protein
LIYELPCGSLKLGNEFFGPIVSCHVATKAYSNMAKQPSLGGLASKQTKPPSLK